MPSSLIFAGLVVIWLLILVPAVARHQQEVARHTGGALSGRVLQRSRRRRGGQEADVVDDGEREDSSPPQEERIIRSPVARSGQADRADVSRGGRYERDWERPPPRYRPGRGGFDPEAAALAARDRYAFRRRVVLALLVTVLATALVAAFALPGVWWLHAAVDLLLVGYLGYLRRQVRLEEAIRARRAARMAGARRARAADDPEPGARTRQGREAARRAAVADEELTSAGRYAEPARPPDVRDPRDRDVPDRYAEPDRLPGPDEQGTTGDRELPEDAEPEEPALPRLAPVPPPPLPDGMTLVEDEDLDLPDVSGVDGRSHRRAAG